MEKNNEINLIGMGRDVKRVRLSVTGLESNCLNLEPAQTAPKHVRNSFYWVRDGYRSVQKYGCIEP